MMRFAAALAMIRRAAPRLPAETVALADALGRVTASPVISAAALPPFDNSAMDGFALAGEADCVAAGSVFDVLGQSAAGDAAQQARGGAFEIMTGARIPDGLDRVVPVEQVEPVDSEQGERPRRIRLLADVPRGQHLRRRGEDIDVGAEAVAAGQLIGAEALMLLAAVGAARIDVVRRPRVAVVCTGRELVDDPSRALADGAIRNSNGPYLAARLRMLGADVVGCVTVGDDVDAFLAALQPMLAAGVDLVISTGAVSMGRYDFVPDALARLGAEIGFHKVAMRPGKPLLFAVLPAGTLFFGLPGNPVSSTVGLRFYVDAALRVMCGMPDEVPVVLPLAAPVRKKAGFRMFQKAQVVVSSAGVAQVALLRGQESFRIVPLLQANAWVALPEDAETLLTGDTVEVYGMHGPLLR